RCLWGEGSYHPVLGVAECRLCLDSHLRVVALLAKYYGGGEDRRTVALLAVT
ncbi:hypothetical protein Z562_02662, partial [Mycobacterium tuberculosis 2099HD]